MVEVDALKDWNGDGREDLDDVKFAIEHGIYKTTQLEGDLHYCAGDFRSEECLELLKQADVVVTNPPFSVFREFVATLMDYRKKFLIIGNQNAITYKEIFPLIMLISACRKELTKILSTACLIRRQGLLSSATFVGSRILRLRGSAKTFRFTKNIRPKNILATTTTTQ